MFSLLMVEGATTVPVTLSTLIDFIGEILTWVFGLVPNLLVQGFNALVNDGAGGLSLLFMWIAIMGFLFLGVGLIKGLISKIRNH